MIEHDDQPADPLLPYPSAQGPTSGFSGTDTSEARARRADRDGTTARRQRETLRIAHIRGWAGITVKQLRELTGWHHGQASSVLSILHKEGLLCRLELTRDRCHVYVVPDKVGTRVTQPHGRAKPEARMWQRVVRLPDDTRLLLTCWDDDPDSLEAALRTFGDDRWNRPLPVEKP